MYKKHFAYLIDPFQRALFLILLPDVDVAHIENVPTIVLEMAFTHNWKDDFAFRSTSDSWGTANKNTSMYHYCTTNPLIGVFPRIY